MVFKIPLVFKAIREFENNLNPKELYIKYKAMKEVLTIKAFILCSVLIFNLTAYFIPKKLTILENYYSVLFVFIIQLIPSYPI